MDVREIKNLDWCEYTFFSLVSSVENWKKNDGRYFKGPLLFLMLCYVDRVEFKAGQVERKFSILRGWTSKILKKRATEEEIEGFGKGHITGRLGLIEDLEKNASDILCSSLKTISTGIVMLGKAILEVGPNAFQNEKPEKAAEAFNQDDEFWQQPSVTNVVDEVLACATSAGDLILMDEFLLEKESSPPLDNKRRLSTIATPTFSLGLNQTPTPPTPPCGDIDESEKLFMYNNMFATREDMYSLSTDEDVSSSVIDIWSLILNIQNLYRGKNKPHIVFFSTKLAYFLTLHNSTGQVTDANRIANFHTRLQNELYTYRSPSLEKADLVFFPICDDKQFSLVCFNFVKDRVDYIDNRSLPEILLFRKNMELFMRFWFKHYNLLEPNIAAQFFLVS
ncbi:uncharacterized protein LOC110719300 isoform X2 [Chenopodium quinoa]|uniref:uncharacterized protein LOC110719300 isoform X2 n=1 Tax=Chenopodium quinoa TaxID=63459 RepID=UPI000B777684|nr:uncharacterized protein LOC110719300 isoform X2 [Chenopodium quinoa]